MLYAGQMWSHPSVYCIATIRRLHAEQMWSHPTVVSSALFRQPWSHHADAQLFISCDPYSDGHTMLITWRLSILLALNIMHNFSFPRHPYSDGHTMLITWRLSILLARAHENKLHALAPSSIEKQPAAAAALGPGGEPGIKIKDCVFYTQD